MFFFYNIISKAVDIAQIILFIRIILSWFPNFNNDFTDFVRSITDPVLDRVKIVVSIGNRGYMDFGPLIIYFALSLIRYIARVILLGF